MRLSFRRAPSGSPRLLGPRAPTPVPSAPGRQRGGGEQQAELEVYPPGRGGLGAQRSDAQPKEESGARSPQAGPRKGS